MKSKFLYLMVLHCPDQPAGHRLRPGCHTDFRTAPTASSRATSAPAATATTAAHG